MSALTAALAAFSGPLHNQTAPVAVDGGEQMVYDSPQSSYSVLPPSSSTSSLSPPKAPPLSLLVPSDRPNEHLAVLLPKQLWKSDSLSTVCDNFFCSVKFSVFERRHHCRKCGGVFCKQCSSQALPLLDTSNLPFLHPPRNIPLASFESPSSPIVVSRVCDDCWDQIHGCPSTPRTPDLVPHSSPISMLERSMSLFNDSGNSSLSSAPCTPPNDVALLRKRHSLRTAPSSSSLRSSSTHPPRRNHVRNSRVTLPDLERSYGELDAYPLKRASVLCKATGGGRWEPKQAPVLVGYRVPIPGGKAPYELQLEKEAEMERLRRENPVIRDGEFQYRFPRDPEPVMISRSFQLSTF